MNRVQKIAAYSAAVTIASPAVLVGLHNAIFPTSAKRLLSPLWKSGDLRMPSELLAFGALRDLVSLKPNVGGTYTGLVKSSVNADATEEMSLFHLGQRISDEDVLHLVSELESDTLILRIHGFGCHQAHWSEEHASELEQHANGLVLDVNYHTAHSILKTGATLNKMLHHIADHAQKAGKRLDLHFQAHSMGALVASAALALELEKQQHGDLRHQLVAWLKGALPTLSQMDDKKIDLISRTKSMVLYAPALRGSPLARDVLDWDQRFSLILSIVPAELKALFPFKFDAPVFQDLSSDMPSISNNPTIDIVILFGKLQCTMVLINAGLEIVINPIDSRLLALMSEVHTVERHTHIEIMKHPSALGIVKNALGFLDRRGGIEDGRHCGHPLFLKNYGQLRL